MNNRLVILSDLHLGRPDGVTDVAQLDALIEEGGRIVLNGDTAEQHDARYRARAVDSLGSLYALARSRGTTLTLLAGNHDPELTNDRGLLVSGGTVLITHGDAFHPAVAPWSVRASAMRVAWAKTISSFPIERRDSLEARFAATRSAGIAERDAPGGYTKPAHLVVRPCAAAIIVAYWWRFPALAARFADRFAPSATTIITGHTHRPCVRTYRGRTIVNTGSFAPPHAPFAVVMSDLKLQFFPVVARTTFGRRTFLLGERPRASMALQAPFDAPCGAGNPALKSLEGNGRPSASPIPFPAANSATRSTRVASPDLSHA